MREAIDSVFDEDDDELMDWMLFYTFSQSESLEKMNYRALIELLDQQNEQALQKEEIMQSSIDKNEEKPQPQQKKMRLASAKPKRPESSTPDKIANQNKRAEVKEPISDRHEEEDKYSSDENSNDKNWNDINDLKDIGDLNNNDDNQQYEESPRPAEKPIAQQQQQKQQQDDYEDDFD